MSDKPSFRLRPLEEKDLETVAVFEGEIAKISFPDDPITDVGFYVKKLKQLMANKDAATFVADSGGELVGWANVSQRSRDQPDCETATQRRPARNECQGCRTVVVLVPS